MPDGVEFRKFAVFCLESARFAASEEEQMSYVELAEFWLRAASAAEGKAPTIPAGASLPENVHAPAA
jgi:hypothetical protein